MEKVTMIGTTSGKLRPPGTAEATISGKLCQSWTMHAIRLHEFGPPENLRYEQVDDPPPGPGEVRIRVAAAGVHFIDTRIRAGQPGPMPPPALPQIPGREVAGVVDAAGDGTHESWLGRRVVAHLGEASGGYPELAVASAEGL